LYQKQKNNVSASGGTLLEAEGLVRPEGLDKLTKLIRLIESRTNDLPVCSIVS
jgi:hypothetical protein